jgi:tRNA A37 methylthiotransferase MiaB
MQNIVVTGCAAQTEPETFAAMDEVTRVIGNAEKFDAKPLRPAAPNDFGDRTHPRRSSSMTSCQCAKPPATWWTG